MEPTTYTKTDNDLSKEYADYRPEFIVEGLIKKNGINILAAERGAGKTRLMLWLAYSIIYECPEVLGYNIKTFGDILFANLEISEKEFKSFCEPIKNHFEKNLNLKPRHELRIMSFKNGTAKICDLLSAVKIHKPLLTIIDNYKLFQYQLLQENNHLREITNSNFGTALKPLNDLIELHGTTILLINHTNKGTRYSPSSADLMFGPGALADFSDQISLLRKTSIDNQKLIVPEKCRYSAEGLITTNLIKITSSDDSSPNPEWLKFELEEENVDEVDYLPSPTGSNRISDKERKDIIQYMTTKSGTMAECAEKILGDCKKKGTVSKIMKKYNKEIQL